MIVGLFEDRALDGSHMTLAVGAALGSLAAVIVGAAVFVALALAVVADFQSIALIVIGASIRSTDGGIGAIAETAIFEVRAVVVFVALRTK